MVSLSRNKGILLPILWMGRPRQGKVIQGSGRWRHLWSGVAITLWVIAGNRTSRCFPTLTWEKRRYVEGLEGGAGGFSKKPCLLERGAGL